MTKDLYLLVDGTHADPDECDLGADNELRHANGMPVALRENGLPMTVKIAAKEGMAVEAAKAGRDAASEAKHAQADESKAAKAETDEVILTVDPTTGKPFEDGPKTVGEEHAETGKDSVEPLKTTDMKPEPARPAPKKASYKTRGK